MTDAECCSRAAWGLVAAMARAPRFLVARGNRPNDRLCGGERTVVGGNGGRGSCWTGAAGELSIRLDNGPTSEVEDSGPLPSLPDPLPSVAGATVALRLQTSPRMTQLEHAGLSSSHFILLPLQYAHPCLDFRCVRRLATGGGAEAAAEAAVVAAPPSPSPLTATGSAVPSTGDMSVGGSGRGIQEQG